MTKLIQPLVPFKAEDGPRNNMGEPIMARGDFYAFMRANCPTRSR